LDRDNSNLKELMASQPQRIAYRAIFSTNPGIEKEPNVIYNDSRFTTQVDLNLPFYGRADSLTVRDTLSINFSEIDIPVEEAIDEAIFKLYYENSYPADILLQLYLADENFIITDTLFHTFTLVNGAAPSEFYSENPDFVAGELETSIPGDDIDNVRQARYIFGEALLTTVGSRDDVRVFENQSLFLRLAVIFDISTNIEDF
jgi:hypothetical protein